MALYLYNMPINTAPWKSNTLLCQIALTMPNPQVYTEKMKDIKPGDLLLLVDIQNDFFPGGALAVPGGDQIIPAINEMVKTAVAHDIPIVVTRDWHPANHQSFKDYGGPYPVHCVQNTYGAEFHPDIKLPPNIIIISKDALEDVTDSCINFTDDDGILYPELLKNLEVKRVWAGGLCMDICVKISILDTAKLGYKVILIKDATHSLDPNAEQDVIDELNAAGVEVW